MVVDLPSGAPVKEAKQSDVKFIPQLEADEEEEVSKIYISNIPSRLRDQGIRNFVAKFGKVEHIYHQKGSRWGFVTYSNKAECEMAIMRIQGVFGMKADFAMKKENQEFEDMVNHYTIPLPEEKLTEEMEAARKTTPFHLPTFKYTFPPLLVTEDDYKNDEMTRFDPKKEFLISNDMFWMERLQKEQKLKKLAKIQENNVEEDNEKIFSLTTLETEALPEIVCFCCQKRKAFYTCSRCNTPYCSTKCKILYRRNHKRFCGRQIPKEPIEHRKMQQPRINFPTDNSLVMVTAIYNPREIFLRSLTPEANSGYLQLLNSVHGYGIGAKYLIEAPQVYTVVLAKKMNIFIRAFVVSVTDDISTVILIDFGSMEKIPWREMKTIRADLASLPRYVFRSNLKDVKSIEYNESVMSFIKNGAMDDEVKITYDAVDAGNIPEIIMKPDMWEFTVNEEIKSNLYQCSAEEILNHKVSINTSRIWPTKNVEIIILDTFDLNQGYIACAIYTRYIEFLHQWEIMQPQCENLVDTYVPLPGEICLVRLEEDGKWHRALCMKANEFRILNVLLIDSGQTGNVSTKNSRKLLVDFNFPSPLMICKIKELPDKIDDTQVEELRKILPQNKRIIARKIVEEDDKILLTLSSKLLFN